MNDLVKVLLAPPVAYCIDANYYKGTTIQQYLKKKRRQLVMEITMEDEEDMKIVSTPVRSISYMADIPTISNLTVFGLAHGFVNHLEKSG